MTNLETKFEDLETQLATQHTAIGNALDALLSALGVPPPTATVTLGDISTQLTAINNNLIGIAIANGSFHDALLDAIGLLNTNTETILNNNSLNAQRLLSTLLSAACPCGDVTLLPPDLTTLPTTATDDAKCARIQYFIDLFFSWYIHVAIYLQSGNISSWQLDNLLQIQLGDLSITTGALADGIPTAVRDTIVGQISSSTYAAGPLSILLLAVNNAGVKSALRQALYGATNAADGSTALYAAIDGLELPSSVAGILKSMFYSGWLNDMYGAVPVVDTSGYDGTICAPLLGEITECHTFASQPFSGPNGIYQEVRTDPAYGPNTAFVAGNFAGWSVRLLSDAGADVRVDFYTTAGVYNPGVLLGDVGDVTVFIQATAAIGIRTGAGLGNSYTIELCPPA